MNKSGWVMAALVVVILVVLLALPVFIAPFSRHMQGYGYGQGSMMGPWMMGGFGFMGPILMLLFVAALVGAVVWLVQTASRSGGPAAPMGGAETPLDILKRRYASGEITKKEFEAMKRDLGL
jgi:putative membrane protein